MCKEKKKLEKGSVPWSVGSFLGTSHQCQQYRTWTMEACPGKSDRGGKGPLKQ